MNINATRTALIGLLAGATFALPCAAFAQTKTAPAATPAPASAAPTTAPASAAPVTVTPDARAAIKELLDVMNTRENLSKTFQAMSQTLPPQMAQAMNRQIEVNTSLTPEQKVKVREGMNQPFENAVKEATAMVGDPKLVDSTIEKMYGIYAKYYTVPEVRQLVAFYKSPLGVKTLTTMPQAINESLQAGVSNFQPRINALMEKTVKTQVDAVTASGAAPAKK